ncbi:DUF6961 family protein [Sphingosinicella humi]|uniref:Uncharacterized protein n=1 Tax=Allosphingosinicella humi TaxID=2068657 RepID=A0A2U2J590_9SPHN|nr:hypothetical protein DF286_11955 [Sphingosinicella humi]
MLSDWEIWACANETVRQHGAAATVFAVTRADELERQGDQAGARTWRLIGARIKELLGPPPGDLN